MLDFKSNYFKGQTSIITVILIILIAIISVVIVWNIIIMIPNQAKNQININSITLGADILSVQLGANDTIAMILVKRNSANGNVTGIKFIFEDINHVVYTYVEKIPINLLETRRFNIENNSLEPKVFNFSKMVKVSVVYFLINNQGVERPTDVLDTREIPRNSGGGGGCTAKTCAQLGKNCGSWDNGCGALINCGNCNPSNEACSNGICVRHCNGVDQCGTLGLLCDGQMYYNCSMNYSNGCYSRKNITLCGSSFFCSPGNGCISIGTCIDNDDDGYGVCPECNVTNGCDHNGNDCNDSNSQIHPNTNELCNRRDDNCNGFIDENNANCSDGIFCNGQETCVNGNCVSGTPVNCSSFSFPGISSCNNNPDNVNFTWDFRAGFTSSCQESAQGNCSIADSLIIHTCNVTLCDAECDSNHLCFSRCNGEIFLNATCNNSCNCNYSPINCSQKNSWYENGNISWNSDGSCIEKEQKQEEYRQFSCLTEGCVFTITQTRWNDTGNTRVLPNGASCGDDNPNTENDTCYNGNCTGEYVENLKDMSLFSEKEAFLISDKDWKDVLPIVSMTTWTGNENCQKGYGTPEDVCVYPTLIWHEEDIGFDADSIIYFMQQYSPSNLTIIGNTPQELDNLLIAEPELGAGLSSDQVYRISPSDYIYYWNNYSIVVYVEDNYELALLSSTYASLINAPLIIKGSANDLPDIFNGRNAICIGDVNPTGASCYRRYNLSDLEKEYIDLTNTDKIILVNPNDLTINVTQNFQPEKSSGQINELYSKTSLAAPFLAGAKREVILSDRLMNYSDYNKVDDFIEEKINITMLYFINNSNGIKRDSKELDNYPITKFNKINFSNNNKKELLYISTYVSEVKFSDKKILLKLHNINEYNFENESIKELKDNYNMQDINDFDVLFNGIAYSRSIQTYPGYKCEIRYYDYNNDYLVTDHNDYCLDLISDNNTIVWTSYGQGLCNYEENICTSDQNCTKKYCGYGGNECQTDTDCGDGDYCFSDYCKTTYDLNLYNIINKQIVRIEENILGYNFDIFGDKVVYKKNENSNYTLYSILENKKENISDSYDIYDKLYIYKNKILWKKYEYNPNINKGSDILYLYDINTKNKINLSSSSYIKEYNILEDKVFWKESDEESFGYCWKSGTTCYNDSDCGEDDFCQKGEAFYVYDVLTDKKTKIIHNESEIKYPVVKDDNIYYISETPVSNYSIYGYLTVMGIPKAIPIKEDMGDISYYDNYRSLDLTEYGDIFLNDRYSDLGVGRIQGTSLSDVSSYIARDLFYNKISDINNVVFLASSFDYEIKLAENWTEVFRDSGNNANCSVYLTEDIHTTKCANAADEDFGWEEYWKNRDLISYLDHGSPSWAGIGYEKIPDLSNSIVYNDACSTCSTYDSFSFCNRVIRKGGLGHLGALGIAWTGNQLYYRTMKGIYYYNLSLGYSFANSYKYNEYYYMTTLLGDPTLYFNQTKRLIKPLPWSY